ncbi:hypothetical protein MCOR27_005995 [Pyricularia oryzae]|nr:hypothetical protein MCOR27_005995 [Pyricularia oryzae]KAI6468255.1 hypothetical protein MCOR15_002241 [Pyricularia oryzae]KAI6539516.1 hypothetical protein MCOR16_001289 [Pyricularia oryzae]KAI6598110.1 hypothetical protein MCOR06_001782 [Pyricularia oryzae]KAI6602491.1 hypothetical protein MCOR12_003724 [Pyricularia oryzae]
MQIKTIDSEESALNGFTNGIAGANVPQPDLAALSDLFDKYEEEAEKRILPDGTSQYMDLEEDQEARESSRHLTHLIEDPWVDHETLNAATPPIENGNDVKFLVVGAGFCGLVYAVRLIEAGFSVDDIRLVDTAGDVGGTWYWNRYPGVQCDSEASIYLPLLEETGYIPKQRYSGGEEIRLHAIRIAEKWGLKNNTLFRTAVTSFTWDDERRRWAVELTTNRGANKKPFNLTATAQFVVLANGVLCHPKIPKVEGLDEFEGQTLHTARWKYDITGGKPGDPDCDKLQGKRVGIIGTGATGVECATALAKCAKELVVFQRTPSAIYERNQRDNDANEWANKVATGPGWWTARNANFAGVMAREADVTENLVDDEWTKLEAYRVLTGGEHAKHPLPLEELPDYLQNMMLFDMPTAERARMRVDQVIKDRKTAEALKAWYPVWCKRPTFHDEYLQIFNQNNVTLVQTDGYGVQRATSKGLVANGKEYKLDVIIFATGYRSPGADFAEQSRMSNATITGCGGITLHYKWLESETGPRSLHGLLTKDFPNLFLTGPTMTGASVSNTYLIDIIGRHTAHVVAAATRRAGKLAAGRVKIQPTDEAEATWTMTLVSRAAYSTPLASCTPGYITDKGEIDFSPKMMGAMIYMPGVNAYAKILEKWREDGGLEGLQVSF